MLDGGRPSHPISLGFNVIDNPGEHDEYKDILWFWHFHGTTFHNEFQHQLIEWRKFREHQEKARKFYVPQNRFHEYEIVIRESQGDLGCRWNLQVLEDRYQQNRLEDWNEFRAFYYQRLKTCQKRIEPKERELSLRQKDVEDGQARLTDVITDLQVLYGRFDEIRASEKEVTQAKLKAESAEKALEAAKLDKSNEKGVSAAIIKTAQQELRSAKANLRNVSGSEEMRRLRDGFDLHILQTVMARVEAELGAAQLEVKRWEVFLKWIDAAGVGTGWPSRAARSLSTR